MTSKRPRTTFSATMPHSKRNARWITSAAARRCLCALAGEGAFLILPDDLGIEPGIFRRATKGTTLAHRLDRAAVSALRAHDCLVGEPRGAKARSARYRLSQTGKALLRRAQTAQASNKSSEQEPSRPFATQHQIPVWREADAKSEKPATHRSDRARTANGPVPRQRVNAAESPLMWLARRKGADGRPFLTAVEFAAGERLRADFDAAGAGPRVAQNWQRFLTVVDTSLTSSSGPSNAARERWSAALQALGPGLSDAACRVCCFLEGLEQLENGQGWAPRSGKVVLKLALQRLVAHYGLDRTGTGYSTQVWRAGDASTARATPD